jgi:dihydroneopterin aldolase/2-amino-4-hydroxy-6-hydroxymethyldihydropteridine diphosphokinase/dihydropteroate synthase
LDLLLHLKSVERLLGRQKTMVNGPRVIDLDLLFYDVDGVMGQGSGVIKVGKEGDVEGTIGDDCGWLEVPHRGVPEREFVLRPLCE